MLEELKITALFREADSSLAYPYLLRYTYPWEALADLPALIREIAATLPRERYDEVCPGVFVAKDATVAPTAYLGAPCIIDAGAEIRHCAYIRGAAIAGRGAVVGNSVELKNCLLFDRVQAPHFNYVGDSILGRGAHLGAGAVTSNVKGDKSPVVIHLPGGGRCETGRKKCGAMLGDGVEVGCNSVLNPGTVIGCNTQIYPLSSVRGYIPPEHIFKAPDRIVAKH